MADTSRSLVMDSGWKIILPPGWITLPTSASRRDAAIRSFVDAQMRGRARDELIRERIELERRLREDLSRAALAGVTQVHSLVEPVAGVPVTASLLVADIVVHAGDDISAQIAALTGPDDSVVEVGEVALADAMALRRHRRHVGPLGEDPDAPDLWQTQVEYLVEAASDRILVLIFSTVTDLVAADLVALFDAMAATLHRTGTGDVAW